jgi:hypothetical protein
MLLLIISISLFSIVYLSVYTIPDPTPTPVANIVGTLDQYNNQIVFQHLGGETLSGDSQLIVHKGDTVNVALLSSYIGDEWEMGETLIYPIFNLVDVYVDAIIIDYDSNSIISNAVLQRGFSILQPYVETKPAINIGKHSATLVMSYDFVTYSGSIYFFYRKVGNATWINTGSIPKNGYATVQLPLNIFDINTTYEYRGAIQYNSNTLYGSTVHFTTSSVLLDTNINNLPDTISFKPYTISATGDIELDNVTLYYRFSEDGTTWYESDEDVNWWNPSWSQRLRLSIDHNQIRGPLTNFTILAHISDPLISNNTQNDGDDLVFLDDNNQRLPHEIESFNQATGTIIAWVKMPILTSTENTTCWLYFGNPTCINQEQVEDTWDDTFVSVYHMDTMTDSTQQDNTLLDVNTYQGSGIISYCRQFTGDKSSYLHVTSSDFDLPNSFTISCWYYSSTTQENYVTLLNKQNSIQKSNDRNWIVTFPHPSHFSLFKASSAGNDDYLKVDTGHKDIEDGSWHHVSVSYDAKKGVAQIITDGGKYIGTDSSLDFSLDGQGDPFYIGREIGETKSYFEGYIDEVYISNVQRNLNWTNTYFNMVLNQTSFVSIIPSGGIGWTKWDNPSVNPDETPPWSWEFPFSELEGFYEFISLGQYNYNSENWPGNADQRCEYDI